jgi:PmbA protein
LTRPVKNLRFIQSILDVLRDVRAIGRERIQCSEYIPVVAPAISAARFNFTGMTGS